MIRSIKTEQDTYSMRNRENSLRIKLYVSVLKYLRVVDINPPPFTSIKSIKGFSSHLTEYVEQLLLLRSMECRQEELESVNT